MNSSYLITQNMYPLYAIYFIPELPERKQISALRSQICKQCYSTQSLQYPVHLSLAQGTNIDSLVLTTLKKELTLFCKSQKPFNLKLKNKTDIRPERFWTGITINKSAQLIQFKNKIENIKNKYSFSAKKMNFAPHVTLAYPAKVNHLQSIDIPFTKLLLNRITIVKKESCNTNWQIYKHIKL